MNRSFTLALVFLALIPLATRDANAALTGVVSGVVAGDDGTPYPNVLLTLSNEQGQTVRETYTESNGVYRLVEIPPGTYNLKAEMVGAEGYKPVVIEGLKVMTNRTVRQDVVLKMVLEDVIVVVGEKIMMDTKTPTNAVNIEREFTERLPQSDDYLQAFGMSGGTNGSGNVRVHGGSQMDNIYLFDGVDTTDPVTNTFGSNLNADAIQEIEVQTAGSPAEYGRFNGGMVNVITKSGSNKFEGTLRVKYVNDQWQDSAKHGVTSESDTAYLEPTLSLGGPIVKDRLWFFATYKYTEVESDLTTVQDSGSDQRQGPFTKVDSSSIWHYPYLKLTFIPTNSHKFVANYNADHAIIHAADDSQTSTPDAQSKQEQGGPFYSLEWTYLRSSSMYFVTRLGYSDGFIKVIPETEDPNTPSTDDYDQGITYGNYGRWNEENRSRLSFQTSLAKYLTERLGNHDLKAGLEYQRTAVDAEDFYPGGVHYTLNNNGWDYMDVQTGGKTSQYYGDYYALYLQDAWELGQGLTLSPGLRYEIAEFTNDVGDDAGSFNTMAAPRLGVTWNPKTLDTAKLFFFTGRFYNALNLQIPNMLNEEAPTYDHYQRPSNQPDADWEYRYSSGSVPNRLDPNLKPEYMDEISGGIEYLVRDNIALGLNGIYRRTRDIIEDVGIFLDAEGNEIPWEEIAAGADYDTLIYEVTNPAGAKKDYYAVEVSGKMNTSFMSLLASYTYSVTKGTVIGSNPGQGGVSKFSAYYDTPSLSENLYGKLPWDCPHYLKISGSVNAPLGVTLGVQTIYRSGYAYSKRTNAPDSVYADYRWYLPEGRGTYRYPAVFNVDLSIQKDVAFGKYGTITVIGDVINVLNQQTVVSRNEEYNPRRPENFNVDSRWVSPRSYVLSLKYSF